VLAQELIRRKRDGGALETREIEWLVRGIADGYVSDAQVGAFAMAVVLRGMSAAERVALTGAMMRSGEVLDWSEAGLPGPALDKHSTGGVGDKVSLLLAPIVAACGGAVPMLAGRGLGHTGGTLDKLESIPGYVATPDLDRLRAVVTEVGCAIAGQTGDLAPADRRLYAIRDATGTVESIPLLVSSILSKKLAAGLDALVMDVKAGSGAFMETIEDACELAAAIVETARGNALPCRALVTDMDRVLGRTAGNALEVREAIDALTGAEADPRLVEVTLELSRERLELGGLDADPADALRSGAAADRFARMVAALGGPADLLEAPDNHLPYAPVAVAALAGREGIVTAIDVRAVGMVVVELGGGRRHEAEGVDHAVGLSEIAAPGERVGRDDRPLAIVHARDAGAAERAAAALRDAFTIGDAAPQGAPVVRERLGAPA
jgi:thymidine phosphorylase